jgi:hypothetical protein
MKGRNETVALLVGRGAPLDIKDKDSGDTDKVGSSGAGLSIGIVALCDGTAGAARYTGTLFVHGEPWPVT